MYQYTIIVGNLGRDPELRYTGRGDAVCSFTVAVNRRWTDPQTSELKEKTTWFRVSAWGRLAETAAQYLRKGSKVLVTGSVDASAWITQEGEPRATLELRAWTIRFLDSRRDVEPEGAPEPPPEELGDIPF